MKNLFTLAFALVATTASANPFDNFVGEYSISGSPKIEKSGDVRECIRFGFPSISGFAVIADTHGYKQSHVLQFSFANSAGHGWVGQPVMEFNDKNEFGTGGSYAKISGDENFAQSEFTSWSSFSSQPLIISIERNGGAYRLKMADSIIENLQVKAACSYEVGLNKK